MTGAEFRKIRVNLSLTQREVAAFLGVTEAAVCRYEAADRKVSGPVAALMGLLRISDGTILMLKREDWIKWALQKKSERGFDRR